MKHLFVIGHPRCGTTSIHSWLSYHQNVNVSKPKEVRYFDNNYHESIEWYDSHWSRPTRRTLLKADCNPAHSYVNFAAERIAMDYPDAYILQVIRNPYNRLHSFWNLFHNMQPGRFPQDFTTFLDEQLPTYDPARFEREANYIPYLDPKGGQYQPFLLESGAYNITHERFSSLFPGRVKTVVFEAMCSYSQMFMYSLVDWLGLPKYESLLPAHAKRLESSWSLGKRRNLPTTNKDLEYRNFNYRRVMSLYDSDVVGMSVKLKIDLFQLWNMK